MFQVSKLGVVLILKGDNSTVWSSNSMVLMRNNLVVVVQLLDNGNLVVWHQNSTNRHLVWQSFDYPGDTLLPGMKFGKNLVTGIEWYSTSWKSPGDPSIGLYSSIIDTNGYPQIFRREGCNTIARLGPWNGLRPQTKALNTKACLTVNYGCTVAQRVVLTWDGKNQFLHWIERIQDWIVYEDIEGDSCARFKLCASDWTNGCQRKKPLNYRSEYGFKKVSGVKLLDTRKSWYNDSMTLTECETACRINCSCVAYANLDVINGGTGCLQWFDELIIIKEFDGDDNIYIRMAASQIAGELEYALDKRIQGVLENGQEVAVKRLSETSHQGFDEFKNELISIAKLQHRNLVKLLGYCIHMKQKAQCLIGHTAFTLYLGLLEAFSIYIKILAFKLSIEISRQLIPPAPVVPAGQQVAPEILAAHNAWIKGSKEIVGLMLMTMELEIQRNLEPLHAHEMLKEQEEGQSVSSYVLKMKGYIDNLERLGHPVTLGLGLHEQTLPKSNARAHNTIRAGKVQKVSRNNVVYFCAIPRAGIFEIDLSNSLTNESSIYAVSSKRAKQDLDSALLWHCRHGHISKKRIEKLQHDGLLNSYDLTTIEKCVSCMSGKMARKPYTHQVERVKFLLGLIHTDVCGPFKIISRQGASYFVTFTDDFIHYGYVYLLKHKHEVFETFKVFQKEVENQLGKTIKLIRSDHGSEYMSQEFLDHLKDHRIIAHRTPPYTPQHNGVSERRNRTLLDMVRSMMSQTTLPMFFWDYALETVARILNMVPTKKVEKTPYKEKLKLSKSQGASTPAEMKRMQNVPYASAVGSIMYAVRCTRPDIAFAQNITSRFQHNPDAGYPTDANDLKSQTGYVFVLNGGVVD
uniref:Putative S-locus glycoprotein domain-containing protein n=1 Tax=Tanacetum cinerariifolium TaxID=118510 RepID=A0A6L2LS23_TANCI|nr:putative S-locus glycoprotein domain-containing protein [Tanacetum cinerariifolium]